MKIASLILGAAGLALAAGVGAIQVYAGHGHGGGPHGGGALMVPQMVEWLANKALDDVNATESQRTRILAVRDRVMSQAKNLHQAHDATHAEFKKQWDQDTMDAAQLHSLVDARIEELRRALHTAVDGVVEVHDTLTPEQRRTLTARVEAMHGAK